MRSGSEIVKKAKKFIIKYWFTISVSVRTRLNLNLVNATCQLEPALTKDVHF
jgi:hypothetical protein